MTIWQNQSGPFRLAPADFNCVVDRFDTRDISQCFLRDLFLVVRSNRSRKHNVTLIAPDRYARLFQMWVEVKQVIYLALENVHGGFMLVMGKLSQSFGL